MITIPVYDMIILPDIVYYFKSDVFQELNIEDVRKDDEVLFLMLKEDKARSEMTADDFYPIGISGKFQSRDDNGVISVRTTNRVNVLQVNVTADEIVASVTLREDIEDLSDEERKERYGRMRDSLLKFVQGFQWGVMARGYILHWKSMEETVSSLAGYLNLSSEEKYEILAADHTSVRTELMEKAIYEFIEMTRVGQEAENEQVESHEKVYREDAIKKQIDFLQRQLDEMHPENVSDVRKFENKIRESGMNETARREAEKILNRMKQEGKDSHEYGMLYDYLDFVTGLSWKKEELTDVDLTEAEKILDKEHYGLKKVKRRIIQQLAVMALNKKQSGSILLFVGAPGTGKTSIGQSIADALHRKYVRVSLGGVRDEAEIRGHRRTYVGAMPGRIMDGMKRCGASNPVMVLDEVDKLSKDFSGDPASALLEVLDPEQNNSFTDHYMNVPYDLSDVLFVCTANTMDTIPEPLLNRMEVIQFPGYTAVEKFQIARRHLLPKAMKAMGIKAQNLKVTDEALEKIISDYTMESGVRGLKKQLDTLCRFAAVKLVKGEQKSLTVSPRRLQEFLDQKPIHHENILEEKQPGIVTGLAWTQAGGEILFIETMFTKGSGKIQITGQLGDVMKESVQIAVTLVKSRYPEKADLFEKNDLHVHVPAGAVPKDGPSAGITLTTAIASLVTGKAVSPEYAMTGEVSLRGRVMPIGGLPEKLMAAQRAGISRVLIPAENVDDLDEVADEVKEKLKIIPVKTVEEVLKKVLK
ncbi:endopeptidase La [Anaerostipes butyraticus]|uniref:endopeptidase La n=1 Tax=Anaerostipes butyraticus TaxID=645466 RepID=A0A916Q8N6_9FIRM|nr:endopeptidase La [Anaerostipes butyraticus]GFO84695.1 Lon protease [Anaerostipes butyraticus]HJC83708.1 endopeptidase La [Candidatus Anaerostipes avicola]